MLRKIALILASLLSLLVVSGLAMYAVNSAPLVPTIAPADPATSARPFVVRIHAQWCPFCLLTKGTWAELQKTYAPKVNLVIFDVTNQKTKEASRAEAKRLGLEEFFDAHSGDLASVFVLDGASKTIKGSVAGSRNLSEYTALIADSLHPSDPPKPR